MISLYFAFLFGLCIPLIAGRFGKFWAADLGSAFFFLWHKPHLPKGINFSRQVYLRAKWVKLFLFSLMWGGTMFFLFCSLKVFFPPQAYVWLASFFCLLALLAVIDAQYFLLPDVFTIPLLLLGFGYAIWGGQVSIEMSFIGAVYSYLLTSVCVLIVHPFLKDCFGAGDVKMLTGLGAWFGIDGISIVLIVSVFSFSIFAFLERKKTGAYGPHLAIGAFVALFALRFYALEFF